MIHLSGNDVLRFSLVSKNWYNLVANSPNSMEKIRICICEPYNGMMWKFTASDANAILTGRRNYKHISMFITRNFTKDHLLILGSFQWKSVALFHHAFKSEIELIDFIGLIEPTVVELHLSAIKIVFSKQWRIGSTNFMFPKLKALKLTNCYTFIHTEIFKSVEHLQSCEIETNPPPITDHQNEEDITRVRAIQAMLIKNSMIEFLELFLYQKDFDNMFMDQRFFSRIRFQLKELKVRKFRKLFDDETNQETNDAQIKNFGKFLQSQKNSLRSLHMLEWLGNDVLELVINTMDELKVLTIREIESYGKLGESIANMNLFKNESIESLNINAKHSNCHELHKMLLNSVPNLKTLHIGTVNQAILDILIEKTIKIESIYVDIFNAYIVPEKEVLRCLKIMQINSSYANNFKDMIRDFDYYTNFETVFLKAVRSFNEKENSFY